MSKRSFDARFFSESDVTIDSRFVMMGSEVEVRNDSGCFRPTHLLMTISSSFSH